MNFISGETTPWLFPPSLEELIDEGHIVRTIEAMVERLDTGAIETHYSTLGRPPFHPKLMLKILVYAYASGLRSSRKIEEACKSNVYYMYLSRRITPDFWTLCLFRRTFTKEIEGLFVQLVRLCVEMKVTKLGKISIDGTKLRASASAKKTKKKDELEKLMKKIREEVRTMLDEAEKVDDEENRLYGDKCGDELPKELQKKETRVKKIEEALKRLQEEDKEKINVTDNEACFMQERHGVITPAYNCQIATTPERVILAYDVVGEATDIKQLQPMVEKVEKNTGVVVQEVKADCGYSSEANYIYAVDEKKMDVYMPDKTFVKERKRCMKEGLPFPSAELCANTAAEKSLVQQAREKLFFPEHYATYKTRMHEIEPVFGHIKFNVGFRQFLLRGRLKVKAEFGLMCLAYNILKIWTHTQQHKKIKGKTNR